MRDLKKRGKGGEKERRDLAAPNPVMRDRQRFLSDQRGACYDRGKKDTKKAPQRLDQGSFSRLLEPKSHTARTLHWRNVVSPWKKRRPERVHSGGTNLVAWGTFETHPYEPKGNSLSPTSSMNSSNQR